MTRIMRLGRRGRTVLSAASVAGVLAGCGAEKRALGPSAPSSPPVSAADPRTPEYQDVAFQVSQGGRLFSWYGCQGCHGEGARGAANLADDQWRYGGDVRAVYTSIAEGRPGGMPAYAGRVPSEPLWRLTAYVRDLHRIPSSRRRRQDLDQEGEPQETQWSGAVR